MNLRPTISAPLPWLTLVIGKLLSKDIALKRYTLKQSIFPRTLRFTKEGLRYVVILFVIGIAAINTGNNLLYLIVAMMLSLIIISGIMSESTLRKITIKRVLPSRIHKGAASAIRLKIENPRSYLPSYSFTVEEIGSDGVAMEKIHVMKLDAKENTVIGARYIFKKRGLIKLDRIAVKTRFPFGLFLKGRQISLKQELLVYPAITAIKTEEVKTISALGETLLQKKGEGSEIHSLRAYAVTDDSRFIHWKISARARKLLVKEFEKETEKKINVIFDNYAELAFEEAVDKAASLANHYMEKGYAVGIKTLSEKIPPASGGAQLHKILSMLALIEPKGKGAPEVRVLVI